MWKTYVSILVPAMFSLLLGAAHFWRAGMYGLSISLVGFMLLAISVHSAWIRLVLKVVLMLLAARWIWICGALVQVRFYMGEPWIRLACILLGVALFTLFSAWLMQKCRAQHFYNRYTGTARESSVAFILVFAVFMLINAMTPHVLIIHRVLPNFGILQGLLLSLWAAHVVRKILNPKTKIQTRMRIWRLFSVVFFGQLLLGLLGNTLFLMTGKLHLPIPGIILAAPIFRGEGYFMLILFTISVILAGSAWCSHLCYFGVWDASLALKRRTEHRRPLPIQVAKLIPYSAPAFLVLTLLVAGGLRYFSMPAQLAIHFALLLGILLFPAMAFVTYRYGITGYCLGICPLGVLATRTRALLPWRIRFTQTCTQCHKCTRVCTSMALDATALQQKKPHPTCTLCANCIAVCKHQGCAVDFTWWTLRQDTIQGTFCVLITSMHSIFLGVAMI